MKFQNLGFFVKNYCLGDLSEYQPSLILNFNLRRNDGHILDNCKTQINSSDVFDNETKGHFNDILDFLQNESYIRNVKTIHIYTPTPTIIIGNNHIKYHIQLNNEFSDDKSDVIYFDYRKEYFRSLTVRIERSICSTIKNLNKYKIYDTLTMINCLVYGSLDFIKDDNMYPINSPLKFTLSSLLRSSELMVCVGLLNSFLGKKASFIFNMALLAGNIFTLRKLLTK